jgi:hypothetical protein
MRSIVSEECHTISVLICVLCIGTLVRLCLCGVLKNTTGFCVTDKFGASPNAVTVCRVATKNVFKN